MKEHGQSRRIFDDPGIYTFLISPCLSFGKSLAEKGVELQRHYFFILFFRCESHSILDPLGVDFLFFSFPVVMSSFFIFFFLLFFVPFLIRQPATIFLNLCWGRNWSPSVWKELDCDE